MLVASTSRMSHGPTFLLPHCHLSTPWFLRIASVLALEPQKTHALSCTNVRTLTDPPRLICWSLDPQYMHWWERIEHWWGEVQWKELRSLVIFRLSLLALPLFSFPLSWEKQCGLPCFSVHDHCLATGPVQWSQSPCSETFLTMGQNIPPSFLGWSPLLQYWKGANIGRFCPHIHPTAWQSLLYILCIGVSRIYICRPELLLEHHTDKSNHPFHYSVDFSVICWPLCLTLRALGPSANLSLSVLTCRQMWVHLLNSLPPIIPHLLSQTNFPAGFLALLHPSSRVSLLSYVKSCPSRFPISLRLAIVSTAPTKLAVVQHLIPSSVSLMQRIGDLLFRFKAKWKIVSCQ